MFHRKYMLGVGWNLCEHLLAKNILSRKNNAMKVIVNEKVIKVEMIE